MTKRQEMTAGQVRVALRRFVRQRASGSRRFADDPVLAELEAARWVAGELDLVMRDLIVRARRGSGGPRSWRLIGDALGVTGQAASKWARQHLLPLEEIDDVAAVREGKSLIALRRGRHVR